MSTLVLSFAVLLALAGAQTAAAEPADDLAAAASALSRSEYAEAIRLLEPLTDREMGAAERARVFSLLSSAQGAMGRTDEALRSASIAEALARQLDDQQVLAQLERVRGRIWRERGAVLRAIGHFKNHLAYAERAGDVRAMAGSYLDLASAYQVMGDWSRTLDYTERSFAVEPNPDEAGRFQYFIQRGIAYFELSERDQAEGDFLEALAIARRRRDRRDESFALGELGSTYWLLDRDSRRALEYLEPAIALAAATGARSLEITWLNNSGGVYRETGDSPEALRRFNRALALEREGRTQRNLPMLLKNIGQTLARQGRDSEAESYLIQARDEADRLNQSKFRWESRMELGRLFASRDPVRAERYFLESIDLLEAGHSNVLLETFRAGALSLQLDIYNPYDLYVELLLQRGSHAQAFQVAERARARAFLDTLSLAREEIGAAVPEEYVQAENALLREISTRQATLRAPTLSGADLERARAALEASEARLTALRARLASDRPAVAHARYPRLMAADDVRREVLGVDETLLMFYLGPRSSAAWVVQQDGVTLIRLPPREAVERAVRAYLAEISTPATVVNRTSARALAAMLVPDLETHVGTGSRLIVIPHGILHHLPFEALIDAQQRYFIERYVISYAPSASSLAYLRRPLANRARGSQVVAVGNPVVRPAPPARERDFQIDWIRDLQPLPHTGDELRRIASLFGTRARVLEQEEANEAALAQSLEGAAALHFATHALVDEERPDRSGLALTLRAPDSDGILQMREIYRMRMRAGLVTLSACRTALGRRLTGEGVMGLSRAFFYAGADAVVASLWNVNDAAASQWMGSFYESLRTGQPIDEAVRSAKLRLLNSGTKLRHPYYWASFVASGHASATLAVDGGPWRSVMVAATLALPLGLLVYLRVRAARRRTSAAELVS
jgi:CHAT domain-containing protein/tetratricopeptide (TPR) repeat protein